MRIIPRLGHAPTTLTLNVYSRVLPAMQQAAARRLESLLSGKNRHRSNLAHYRHTK